MTLKVYEVTREGTVRVVRPEAEVVPVAVVDHTAAFPDCQCPQHRSEGTDAAYRVFVEHTARCATCRAGAPCATAAHLCRAWRETRR
ncbi:hypothetical protein [Streptomyces laculatispora]|uniref:hypothetical protein n=1 Tax=Streptomyces laculatispora TaxID=887464 RepID=UPI001A94D3AC|nr:hypothetical protein [Streptomyces laculatispora]MBO0918844.1 hypothetical protein [Streptomyces laculatispora]